ncbi:MAG: SPOR domain-containing protein [Phycisphaerales bacterium]|nr:SPOR domain-containing protein [Phycisphaerales bacterium]
MTVRSLVAALLTVALLGLGGCASDGGSRGLDTALKSYQSGRYQEAYDTASRLTSSTDPQIRYDAGYVAGISAYRLGRLAAARTNLLLGVRSVNHDTSGRARAMLGVVDLDAGHETLAADSFRQAADLLEGENRRQAALAAAAAYDRAGDVDKASMWRRLADGVDPLPIVDGARFTLQVGAFSARRNANQAAADVARRASSYGFGTPRIVTKRMSSGTRYLVHVGAFSTRIAAERALAQLGAPGSYITLATD